MRWLDGITDSMNMNLSKRWETQEPGVLQSMGSQRVGRNVGTKQRQQCRCSLLTGQLGSESWKCMLAVFGSLRAPNTIQQTHYTPLLTENTSILGFIALCKFFFFFNKSKVCVNPVLGKSIGIIFPNVFAARFMSLCHVLIILMTIQTFFFFWLGCAACGISVHQPGIEPTPLSMGTRSLNHWTSREVPRPCHQYNLCYGDL